MTRTLVNSAQPYAKNTFINSNFDFWQRGTSFTNPSSTTYGPDRWAFGGSGTGVIFSRQSFGQQIEVPNSPKYYLRCTATSLTSARDIRQPIESVGTFAGKTVTMSFWARCVSGTYTATNGVGLIQNFGTGGSPSSFVAPTGQTITLTPNWVKYSFTFSVPSIVGKTLGTNNNDYIAFYVNTPGSGTFTADFAEFMINEGSQALDWNLAGTNLQGELAMCQRYYEKSYIVDTAPNTNTAIGRAVCAVTAQTASVISLSTLVPFKVPKRSEVISLSFFNTGSGAGTWSFIQPGSGSSTAFNVVTNVLSSQGFEISQGATPPTFPTTTMFVAHGHWTADAEL